MADRKFSTVPDLATLVHTRQSFDFTSIHRVKVADQVVVLRVLISINLASRASGAKLEAFSKQSDQWNQLARLQADQIYVRYDEMPTPQEAWELFKDNNDTHESMFEYMQNPESRKLFEEFYPEFARNTNENFEAIIEQLLAVAEVIYL
jgi:hypothetical protein